MDDVLIGRARFSDLTTAETAVRTAVVTRRHAALLWWTPLWAIMREAVLSFRMGRKWDSETAAIERLVDFKPECRPEVDLLDECTLVLRVPIEAMRLYIDFDVDVNNSEVTVTVRGDATEETGRQTRVEAAYMAAEVEQADGVYARG